MKFAGILTLFTLALVLLAGFTAAKKHDDHKKTDDHKKHHESGWDKFKHIGGDILHGAEDAEGIARLF
ncbi:unnamed protein product [Hermetia illucens]|uniref:Uncharacterized protein n=1 Tax=Hermetia illucens TaxID=343691 RepID=A0A7R8ULG2_HERIL|nr:unnamed protein product [Hermetia illucens]